MEDVSNSDSGSNSIVSPENIMVVPIEVCSIFVLFQLKNIETKVFVSVFLFLFLSQAPAPEVIEEQLNLILPGCLLPYQKEIKRLIFIEKQKFLKNKRFAAVFSKTSLNPVFKNRNSLKKLISKTKIV